MAGAPLSSRGDVHITEDSPVELRCAVAALRGDAVLLTHRADRGGWVLPGGRPQLDEGISAGARRQTGEETGLDVYRFPPRLRCGGYARHLGEPLVASGPTGRDLAFRHAGHAVTGRPCPRIPNRSDG